MNNSNQFHISTKGFPPKTETTSSPTNALDKCKGIASRPPTRFEGKKGFKCYSYDHFQANCPNKKTISIKEVEKIQALAEETSFAEFENEEHTLVTLDIGELLVIHRALHVKEVPFKAS